MRRITRELRQQGILVNLKRIRRLMQSLGLKGKGAPRKTKYCSTTDSNHKLLAPPNHLNRQFVVNKPDRWWVGDITFIWTDIGWCYLATVIDLFSRKVVGWQVGTTINATLVGSAFEKAIKSRNITGKELSFHSDRGVQYCSQEFKAILKTYGVQQSMSRVGNCWDNSIAESFFRALKVERIKGLKIAGIREAKDIIFNYIENFYNCRRQHSFLLGMSPISWEIATGMNPEIIERRNKMFLKSKDKVIKN